MNIKCINLKKSIYKMFTNALLKPKKSIILFTKTLPESSKRLNILFNRDIMKNRSVLINSFIELRAKGETFDDIVNAIKVSKPTLIKWSKLYEDEISYTERALAEATAAEIVKHNKQFIISFAEFLTRAAKQKQTDENAYNKVNRRASKRIFAMFKKYLQSIEIEVWKTGDIKKIKINWEKSGIE